MKNELKSSLCYKCGICCRLFLINLTEKEWLSGRYATDLKIFPPEESFINIQKYGGNILKQKKDGSCIYLGNRLCTIHKDRPQACRNFSCRSHLAKYKDMIKMIRKNVAFHSGN